MTILSKITFDGIMRFCFEESLMGFVYNTLRGCQKLPEVFEMQELHECIYCPKVSDRWVCLECRKYNMVEKMIATTWIQCWWRGILLQRELARIHETYMPATNNENVVPLLEDA
jgi:hypothetical protein